MTTAATLTASVPVLTTERLVLREPRLADHDAMLAFMTGDRARYVGGPYADWQVWGALIAGIGHWVLRGWGFWTVEDRATGAVAGRVGIIHHVDWPEPELGWHLFDSFEGRGLAHEAALAARRHAQGPMGLGPLISQIDPDNARSLALAARLGATFERDATLRGRPCQIWRHPAVTG